MDLTDKAHKDALHEKFGISGDVEQQVELLAFLRTYQQQANSKTQQPLERTTRLSDATQGAKAELMDVLFLPERGASWPNKPTSSQHVDGFV